jgi:hypothetical protein
MPLNPDDFSAFSAASGKMRLPRSPAKMRKKMRN